MSYALPGPLARRSTRGWIVAGYAQAVAAVAFATGLSWLMFPFFEPANLIMTYLLAIVAIAARYGRGPSVVASVVSVAAFDFFFVPPYFTFVVADTQYLLTFTVMLVVGLVISGLTARIRRQAEAARQREQRTAALYAMSRELAATGDVDALIAIAARHLTEVFGAEVAVLLPDAEGTLEVRRTEGRPALEENELTLSRWAFEHGQTAGLGAARSNGARAVHVPLLGPRGPIGVVSVRPPGRDALTAPDPLRQLETFVNQTALALEPDAPRQRSPGRARARRDRAAPQRALDLGLTRPPHTARGHHGRGDDDPRVRRAAGCAGPAGAARVRPRRSGAPQPARPEPAGDDAARVGRPRAQP